MRIKQINYSLLLVNSTMTSTCSLTEEQYKHTHRLCIDLFKNHVYMSMCGPGDLGKLQTLLGLAVLVVLVIPPNGKYICVGACGPGAFRRFIFLTFYVCK